MNTLLETMKNNNIHGVSYYDGEYHYLGNVHKTTIFEAASLTKVLFAYIVLLLNEQKVIDINKPLVSYKVNFKTFKDDRINKVTACHILSHTSGLVNWSHQDELTLKFEPGTKMLYSGEGYFYLQKVVESITNSKIDDLFEKYIFTPFHMESSSLVKNSMVLSNLSNSYSKDGKEEKNEYMEISNVAYSLYTTLEDYQRFVKFGLLSKPSFIKRIFEKYIDINEDVGWCLGLGIVKDEFYFQWGDNGNFKSFLCIDINKDKNYLFFTNSYNGLTIVKDILQKYYPDIVKAFEAIEII